MNILYTPSSAFTVPDWIAAGQSLSFSRDKNMLKVKEQGVLYPHESILIRYADVFKRYIITKKFTDEEMGKYAYRPKWFCREYYGTPELWAEILYINGMVSQMEFNKPTIKVYADVIFDAFEELRAVYRDELNANREEVDSD